MKNKASNSYVNWFHRIPTAVVVAAVSWSMVRLPAQSSFGCLCIDITGALDGRLFLAGFSLGYENKQEICSVSEFH